MPDLADVRIPEAGLRLDVLDDVDPCAGRVKEAEAALPPWLVAEGVGDLHTGARQALELWWSGTSTLRSLRHLQPDTTDAQTHRLQGLVHVDGGRQHHGTR